MYIRRKVFSILDTEIGERLFSTTDYILDQREFAGETKRRNKALKRQWLEKLGEERGKRIAKDNSSLASFDKRSKRLTDSISDFHGGQKGAGDVFLGRKELKSRGRGVDNLAENADFKRRNPELFKTYRKVEAMNNSMRSTLARDRIVPRAPRPTTLNPVIKTESKLSKLARIGKNFLKLKK